MTKGSRPRVLVLSRNYPNAVVPTRGLWAERLVAASLPLAEPTVVAPVPYVPPGAPLAELRHIRRLPQRRRDGEVDVHLPRIPTTPGYLLHALDARLAYPFVRRVADRLHRERPFALIHAHFIHPEGVMAARLGARYGIPTVTTEHAPWVPWLDAHPPVRRQVVSALPRIRLVTAVSEFVRRTVVSVVGDAVETAVLPNLVDGDVFRGRGQDEHPDPNQLLFVGAVRRVKGLDVLVRALDLLRRRRPSLRLVVVGEPFLRAYRRDEGAVRRLIDRLGLSQHVEFAGPASPGDVAAAMRRSALLVLPSRLEAFGAVLIEALASGTPVVATRSGGPEEVVTSAVGRLVPPEDAEALAATVDGLLGRLGSFDPDRLREYALGRFGPAAATARLAELYDRALEKPARRPTTAGRPAGWSPSGRPPGVDQEPGGEPREPGFA